MDLTTLKSRDYLGSFLNDNGLVGIGVEVGVLSGGNARQIMKTWQGQLLHLVDPWEKIDPAVYREAQTWPPEACYQECQKLAAEYPLRVNLYKMFSVDASRLFPDGYLDFVYLDGNHSYEAVSEDLRAWWPKIKSGGLFGGHDYRVEVGNGQYCQVRPAVDDWMACGNLIGNVPFSYTNVRIESDPGWCGSWWIIKP